MSSASTPTVYIIDDDVHIRAAIQALLKAEGLHTESFGTPHEFFGRQRSEGPSCLILDVKLPGMNGLQFQRKLIEGGIVIPIIFITGHGDIPMTVQAMKAGAAEFLTKPFNDEDLLGAVKQALERDRLTLQHQAEIADLQKRYATLTPREREVMSLVITGLLNKQIAAELGISEIMVKVHRGQVMHKMQVGSVAELVRIAAKLTLQ